MRSALMAFTLSAFLIAAPAAVAAPTCQDQAGATVRCGSPTAMPVGWTAPSGQPASEGQIAPDELAALIAIVGGLFALIALMPRFDNANGNRWDRQEGDD